MNKLSCILVFAYMFLPKADTGAQVYNIEKFGAVGDGITLNTISIQNAINTCNEYGGGMVLIPKGIFITGTVILKSNIHLFLDPGAILRGSEKLSDYSPFNNVHYGMLYSENSENITISGSGNIDGNGDNFFDLTKAKTIGWEITQYTRQKENYRKIADGGIGDGPIVPRDRPYQMFIFSNCKRITIRDIFITQAPMWTMHFADCDGVNVDGIRLWTNMLAPNADGIDITSCNNVVITNCDIRSGDDAIAITGYDHHFEIPGFIHLRHPSDNIIVSNCNLQSYSSGIRIGSLDQNTIRNIIVSNCNITNSTRGIGIFLRDEGSLENINISNVVIETKIRTGDWWGNGEPIHISAIRGKEGVRLGKIKNIRFNNIICKSDNGILIYGTEESVIENISFSNVSLELTDSELNDVAGGNIDLRGCIGNENQIFQRDLPAVFARYVSGLSIDNFKLEWIDTRMPYFTHGIEVNNFNDLVIRRFSGSASPVNPKAFPVFLENGSGADIDKNEGLMKKNVK